MIIKFSNHLLVIMSVFYSFIGYAHDTDKAYFKIQEEGKNTIVFAEFPWSIRKVIDNIPSKQGENIHDKMYSYLRKNLVLENKNGKVLPFEKVELIKSKKEEGHHSMINYKIYFKGNDLFKVTNTIMCDYFKNQLNYHLLFDLTDTEITSVKNSSFLVKEKESPFKLGVTYQVVLLLFVLVFVIYAMFKKGVL